MKKTLKKLFVVLGSIVLCLAILTGVAYVTLVYVYDRQTVICSVEEYGKYRGNTDNKAVRNYINSFFPEEIEDYFRDVEYSYKASYGDTYAFEAFLEFVIEDEATYREFVTEYTKGLPQKQFIYDNSFTEYTIHDVIDYIIREDEYYDESQQQYASISDARIGKILCDDEAHRIIFVALGVYDGGGVTTDFLNTYFNRFNIDPWEYEERLAPFYHPLGGLD